MKGTRRDRECWQASDPGKSCDPAGEKPGEEVADPLSSHLLPGSLSISLPLPLSGSLVGKQGHLACCGNSQGPSPRAEDRVERRSGGDGTCLAQRMESFHRLLLNISKPASRKVFPVCIPTGGGMRGRLLDLPHHCVLSFRNFGQLDREIIMAFDC